MSVVEVLMMPYGMFLAFLEYRNKSIDRENKALKDVNIRRRNSANTGGR